MNIYKIDVLPNGYLEVIDAVDRKPPNDDGFIYATEKELNKIDPMFIINQLDLKGLINEM